MRRVRTVAGLLGLLAFAVAWPILIGTGAGPANDVAAFDTGSSPVTNSLNCPDDDLEQNDSQSEASPVFIPGFYPDLRVCTGDEDFYSFPLGLNEEIEITGFFTDSGGDIDMSLRNPGGDTVALSTSDTDNEKIVYSAAEAGTHYLQVTLVNDPDSLTGSGYDLQIDVMSACADDVFENNDTQSSAQLAVVPFHTFNLRLCPGDQDWFSVFLLAGSAVQVQAFFPHAEGNVDIGLFDSEGGFLTSSISLTDYEDFSYEVTETGTYAILVNLETDTGLAAGNAYDLQASQPDALVICADDSYEDNDDFEEASFVSLPFFEPELRACADDKDDFFAIDVSAGDEIEISVIQAGTGTKGGPSAAARGFAFAFFEGDTNDDIINFGLMVEDSTVTHIFTANVTGTHYFSFEQTGPAPSNSYQLIIVGAKPPTPTPTPTPTATPPADADLIVKNIDVSPPKPEAGESVDITVEVSNIGSAPAGPFLIDFYGNMAGPPALGEEGDFFCNVGGLAAGASTECVASGPYNNPGSFDLWAQVDTDEDVAESNEGNNVFGPQKLDVNEPDAPTSTPTSTPVATSTPTSTPPPASTSTPTNTPASGLIGDVNCNDVINAIDAALLLQFGAGLFQFLLCEENADVSLDGFINSIDAALILQFVAGLIGTLPP